VRSPAHNPQEDSEEDGSSSPCHTNHAAAKTTGTPTGTQDPRGAVEERPVVRHAGEEERRPRLGEQEGDGREEREEAGRGIRLVTLLPRPRKVIQI